MGQVLFLALGKKWKEQSRQIFCFYETCILGVGTANKQATRKAGSFVLSTREEKEDEAEEEERGGQG